MIYARLGFRNCGWTIGLLACIIYVLSLRADAQLPASSIPSLVQAPHSVNLGATSYYDGFSSLRPGFALLDYVTFDHSNSLSNNTGGESTLYDRPRLNTFVDIAQFSWITPLPLKGNTLGTDVFLKVISLHTSNGPNGQTLSNNGTQLGDLTFATFLQFKPILAKQRPVASFRVAFSATAPTGGFDANQKVNQSSGFWSLFPYAAATFLPKPKWEISSRITYGYNFTTSRFSNPPAIPGFVFQNGQAGQLLATNFDSSYSVTKKLALGANGFALLQYQNNRINGISLPNTQAKSLYLGPGLQWKPKDNLILNFNVYLPVTVRNIDNGPQFNLQIIRPLHFFPGRRG